MGTVDQSASLGAQDAAARAEGLPPASRPDATSPAANPDPFTGVGRDRLVRLAYRFLWNQADAEDVAQDALSIAQARSGEIRDPSRRWSWVCRIVVRQCQTGLRAKSRWRRHGPLLARDRTALETSAAEKHSTLDDLKEVIRHLLPALPQRQREVLVLKHLEGMSFEQIAEALEISPATARVHAHAGRERLRELIRERQVELLVE